MLSIGCQPCAECCECCAAASERAEGLSALKGPRYCVVGKHHVKTPRWKVVFKDSDSAWKVYTKDKLYMVLETSPMLSQEQVDLPGPQELWCCNACFLNAGKTAFGFLRKNGAHLARDGDKSQPGGTGCEDPMLTRPAVAGYKRTAAEALNKAQAATVTIRRLSHLSSYVLCFLSLQVFGYRGSVSAAYVLRFLSLLRGCFGGNSGCAGL